MKFKGLYKYLSKPICPSLSVITFKIIYIISINPFHHFINM